MSVIDYNAGMALPITGKDPRVEVYCKNEHSPISILPSEILLHIFSFLPFSKSVENTCHTWKWLYNKAFLWKEKWERAILSLYVLDFCKTDFVNKSNAELELNQKYNDYYSRLTVLRSKMQKVSIKKVFGNPSGQEITCIDTEKNLLICGTAGGKVRLYSLYSGANTSLSSRFVGEVFSQIGSFHEGGFALGILEYKEHSYGNFCLVDLKKKESELEWFKSPSQVNMFALDHTTERLVSGDRDRVIRLWDVSTKTRVVAFEVESKIRDLGLNTNYLYSISREKEEEGSTLSCWDCRAPEICGKTPVSAPISRLAVNENYLAYGGKEIYIFDLRMEGRPLFLQKESVEIRNIALQNDCCLITDEWKVKIFDLLAGSSFTFENQTFEENALCIPGENCFVAPQTCSYDLEFVVIAKSIVRLWSS